MMAGDALKGDAANNFAFEGFFQGPRICIGRNFALAAIKAALAELVRQWHFVGVETNDGRGALLANGDEKLGRGVSDGLRSPLVFSWPIPYRVPPSRCPLPIVLQLHGQIAQTLGLEDVNPNALQVRFETLSIVIAPKGGLRVRYKRLPSISKSETEAHGA